MGNVAPAGDGAATSGSVSEVPKVSATHEFTIREYSRTKGMGVGKSILSEYFVVDGRRWYVRFYPDGYSANDKDWVSLYVQTLYKPVFSTVRAEFAFQLLNADGDAVFTRRCGRACKYNVCCNSWGLRRLITREQLEGAAFGAINGDTLTVRCTVSVLLNNRRASGGGAAPPAGVPVPPSCHAESAMRFLASGRAPFDVRFSVGGAVFEAHRVVVAGQSPWFESLLYGQGSEARSDCVDIGGTPPDAFEGVLHYIYNDTLPAGATEDGENADALTRGLLVAADMYLLERLKKMCANRLCDFVKEGTVDGIMELAVTHSCHELEQACRNYLTRRDFLRSLDNSQPQQ